MKYLKLKFLLMFFALALAIPPAWAEEVTVTKTVNQLVTENDWTTGGSVCYTSFNLDDNIRISTTGTSPCGGIYGTTTHDWRLYYNSGGNVIVTANNDCTLKSVKFVYTTNNNGTLSGINSGTEYSVSGTSVTYAVSLSSGNKNGQVRITSFTVTYESSGLPPTAKPTFSVPAGTYYEPKSVSISCDTEGATIHYTTDGSNPTATSAEYSTPITVNQSMTIKAIAMKDGYSNSAIAEAAYEIIDPSTLTTYRKITSTNDLTNGDYLIVCESQNVAFDGSRSDADIDKTLNSFSVNPQDGVIRTDKAGYFTIKAISGSQQRSIRSASGVAIGRGIADNGMDHTDGDLVYPNIITFVNGNAVIKGEGNYNLMYFNSGGNSRFRYYNNNQTAIQLYKKDSNNPVITVEPEDGLIINDATGDNKTGTLTATVEPAGEIIAETTSGWSANVDGNSVTYDGKALHAEGTVTYKSTDADDVDADLEYNYTGPLYIMGTVNNGSWSANNMVDLEGPDADGIYTANFTSAVGNEEKSWISFSKRKGTNWDSWNEIKDYRFTPLGDTPYTAYWLTEEKIGEWIGFDFDPDPSHVDNQPLRMDPGTYTITIDAKNNKFKIERYMETVATPEFSVEAGTYTENQTVEITCDTGGATIYYTTDGSDPDNTCTEYTGPITVDQTMTLKAIAMMDGWNNSAIASATYTINKPKIYNKVTHPSQLIAGKKYILVYEATPAFMGGISTSGSNYGLSITGPEIIDNSGTNSVNIFGHNDIKELTLSGNENEWLFHNGDGYLAWGGGNSLKINNVTPENVTKESKWTVNSVETGFSLFSNNSSSTRVLQYNTNDPRFACYAGGQKDAVLYVEDGVEPVLPTKVETPTFSPEEGTYNEAQNVTISCETSGATIYYTTDGSTPTNESAVYSDAIPVNKTMTIKAIAVKDGMENSEVAEATYTIIYNVNNLAAAKALDDDAEFNFNGGVVVTFKQSYNNGTHTLIGLRDNNATEGGGVFHNAKASIYSALEKGKVLNPGWTADKETHEGWIQFEDINNVTTAENTVEVLPFDRTNSTLTAANQSEYIVLNNVTINGTTLTVNNGAKGATYTLYDLFNNDEVTITDGQYKSLVGVVGVNGETVYVYPLEMTPKDNLTLGFAPASVSLYVGETFTAPALTGVPEGETIDVTYTSENPDVATVVDNVVKLVEGATGTATITATFDGDANYNPTTATYTITVKPKENVTLSFGENPDVELYVGETFTAPELTTNPEGLDVTYTVTNNNPEVEVAKINEEGEVELTGKAGTATVTATYAGNNQYNEARATYTITVKAKENVTLSFGENPDVELYVGETFTAPTLTTNPEGLEVTYNVQNGEVEIAQIVDGAVVVSTENAGTATVTATYAGNNQYNSATASYNITIKAKENVTLSFGENPDVELYVGETFTAPTLTTNPEGLEVTYTVQNGEVEVAKIVNGEVVLTGNAGTATVIATYAGNNQYNSATASYTITVNDVVVALAAPTFAPAAGTYTEPKEVAIACATPGVTIEYKIGDGNWTLYEKPFEVKNSCTVTATASKGDKVVYNDSEVAEAKYTINTLPAAQIDNKYYYLVNNALPEMYANVAGRRTLNFVADPADKAGTVFRVMTDPDTIGQVETLRSQGVDMQGYAKRAMNYVTPIVQMVVNKLNDMDGVDDATGTGSILGENGLGKILAEFNKSFDYHLYVEGNAGAYRIYARTPSMQRVVDFYNNPDNKSQIQEKLPMLEGYINQVLAKIRSKVPAGMNANVFEPFSLVKVWEKMGSKLIKPVKGENDDITAIMAFYDQVLSNKEYVWDFAYQTAKIYLDNIKGTQTYADLDPEYKLYIEKMEEIRPETKFFIIQNGNDLDYVREDHTYIQNNNDQTFWTLTERPYFTVNFPEENKYGSKLVTTLYTDFAYDVPEDVTAYKVTDIDANGFATIADLGKNVPAQTPVLLMTDAAAKATATTKSVTLNTTDGTRPDGNLLEGPDYLINKYKITSPTVEALFAIAAGVVGGEESDAYQTYVKPYEYLKLRTSGTVNNRYFWGLNSDDLKKCSEKNSEDKLDCVVRSLGVNDEGKDIGFYRNREALLANQAFIPNIEFNPILLEVVATPTFDPEAGTYNEAQTVTIACETEGATIYYKMGDEENWTKYDPEQPINVAQTTTIQAYAVKDGLGDSEIAEATYTIELPAEAPTFNPVPGSYEEAQDVTIIAPEGATVSYRIDGGEWQTYTEGEDIHVDATQTIEAKVVMEGMSESAVATGYYVIDIPEALPTNMPVFDGYYSILNSGKYANVQGRKTLTFTTEPDAQAGTVIRLKSDNTGKVEVLRSQAADLQRYAYRALDYVPDIVQIVVDKLGAEGEGHILGQEGLDAIMDKFDKSFKPDLYIEKAGENGYRIYGKTPSMQPVVDFYRENKDKVEAKLPDLVAFINSALAKLRAKAEQAGMNGDNVFVDFDLKTIWERMGGNLTDPEVDEMGFYRDVLNYKDNVWNFAYQTATFYLEKIKNTSTYESLLDELGEYAQYLDKIDQIHPDFKYYIVANEGVTKPDFISEGNTDIANDAARTIWTIEPRENFTVNFPAENKLGDEYVTTLYTDFAYTLPEGVTAWAVESVNEYGIAKLAKVDGTTIAAQTPVLLKSTTAGDVATFGITTAEGTVPATNELVGPDYLIETYQIKTPEVVKLFEAIKSVLGENIYNDLVEDYGHLQLRNSGTVNNKYFWGLNEEEVKSCAETNPETGKLVKVVRSLGIKDDILGFNDNEHVYTNKALLVSTEHSAINFTLRGDINRDGQITIADVPALIDILLELPAEPYHEPSELYPNYPKGLDYEAADFNENGDITIHDVSALIDYLLGV